jgi:hypothetical protein
LGSNLIHGGKIVEQGESGAFLMEPSTITQVPSCPPSPPVK